MNLIASVQTSADTGPITLGYVLGALLAATLLALMFLIPAYLDSNFHRRGVARLRAHRRQPTKGAHVHRH